MFFVWLGDLLGQLMDLLDEVTFFYGISLWDLLIFFVVAYDLEQIIKAIFQSSSGSSEKSGIPAEQPTKKGDSA
jgi:hypothetical protein